MIGYVKGKILVKGKGFLIVEAARVGYKVLVSENTLKTSEKKSEIELFVWPYLKRETIELYGCPTQKEFELFEVLEKLPGIGPKTALSLAVIGSLEKLRKAIEEKDEELFTSIKGMGKKRIQRLILELTGKFRELEKSKYRNVEMSSKDEAFTALVALGFSKNTVKIALSKLPKEVKGTKERIKMGLRVLGER